jgi:hypothetical protein
VTYMRNRAMDYAKCSRSRESSVWTGSTRASQAGYGFDQYWLEQPLPLDRWRVPAARLGLNLEHHIHAFDHLREGREALSVRVALPAEVRVVIQCK